MKQAGGTQLDPLAKGITSPRFDDERTVQSARRVVPLAKIASKSRRRFSLSAVTFLFVTLAGGMLVYSEWNRRKSSDPYSSVDSTRPPATETTQGPEVESRPRQILGGSLPNTEIRKSFKAKSVAQAVVGKAEPPFGTRVSGKVNQARHDDAVLTPGRKEERGAERPQRTITGSLDMDKPRLDDRILMPERREARSLERPRRAGKRSRTDSVSDIFRIEDIFRGSRGP